MSPAKLPFKCQCATTAHTLKIPRTLEDNCLGHVHFKVFSDDQVTLGSYVNLIARYWLFKRSPYLARDAATARSAKSSCGII